MPATSAEGLLLVDKPAGMTSHDVVAVARRALREKRIGHAGTLDPFATGLLVMMVGAGTRLLAYLPGEPKRYRATIRFGASTDTDDLTGTVTAERPLPSASAVELGISALTGPIAQVPPAYSAKQVTGVRAYDAARRGDPLALAPVPVDVGEWIVHSRGGSDWDVEIVCGGGTYIRALARDLGRLAGSVAHLVALRRVASGPYTVNDATSLGSLREGGAPLLPLAAAVAHLPVRRLSADERVRIGRGQSVAAEMPAQVVGPIAMLDVDGTLVGIGQREDALIRPKVVLRAA